VELPGRTVVITGASSGIGAATADAIAKRGAHVVLVARRESALEEVAQRVRDAGGTADVVPCDLTDADAVTQAGATIRRRTGIPDVLVNNAGAGRWLFVHETPPQEVVTMMAAPYFAAFWMTREMLPGMLRRGSGHIVNLTSPAGFSAWPGGTGYVVARWAMRGFDEALRADLHRTKLRVSLVVPGEVTSPYFANNPGSQERLPKASRLYRRLEPPEVALAIVKAVEQERDRVVLPAMLRLTLLSHRLWPRPTQWLANATGARLAIPTSDEPA
jgi:short-subunit dehydrogenase